jgi:hypothetical protein
MSNTFNEYIKEWVKLDNYTKNLNEKNREIREKKKEIKDYIMEYANSSNMNNSTIKISDGKLKLTEVKQTAPLNLKYIEKCLSECIGNKDQVNILMNYIKENRETKHSYDIKRYYEKK